MSTSSKSPRRVALAALAAAKESLSPYAHRFAPKVFTQPQLLACLVLKRFFRTDYRGISAILADAPKLCEDLGLQKVPHWTTLQKAHARLLRLAAARGLLAASNALLDAERKPPRRGRRAAADSTGMEATSRSAYFTSRRDKSGRRVAYRRFPKLSLLADTKTHMVLAALTGVGPKPDIRELAPLLDEAAGPVPIGHVLADAGYDSEPNHRYAREEHGVHTTIPPRRGRPSEKPPTGRYRRMMKRTLHLRGYGDRWQVETVHSMIKRNQGAAVRGHGHHAQNREMRLAAITHNLAILRAA
jgi:hypothetical protein